MITFTLPEQWRQLAWQNQKIVYHLIIQSAWETVNTFSQNDKQLQGTTGAVTVLHTHTRRLDYHPHVHLVMPAGAINRKERCWRSKKGKYLFNHKDGCGGGQLLRLNWPQNTVTVKEIFP